MLFGLDDNRVGPRTTYYTRFRPPNPERARFLEVNSAAQCNAYEECCAKTAEPIELPFAVVSEVVQRNHYAG